LSSSRIIQRQWCKPEVKEEEEEEKKKENFNFCTRMKHLMGIQ